MCIDQTKTVSTIINLHRLRSQVLPGQLHCYFLNGDAPVQDGRALQGALVSKIPFRHPAQVPLLLDIIRHQAAYNTLIGSCVKRTSIKEGICLLSGRVWSVLCLMDLTCLDMYLLAVCQTAQACYSSRSALSPIPASASRFSIQSTSL